MPERVSFRQRRAIGIAVTASALGAAAGINWWHEVRLGHAAFFTGSTLLASLVMLMLLGLRRRLPMWPLGHMSVWTQVHLYTGLFAAGVYWLHVPTLIAGGIFESALAVVFLLVTASGVYGIIASRTLPRRLTMVNGEYRYDQLAWHRQQIARSADSILGELREATSLAVLDPFHTQYLKPFFEAPVGPARLIAPSSKRRRRLLHALQDLDRYLESEGRRAASRFAALVRCRDDLDYQHALQWRMRLWVVVHGTLSLVLLGGGILHAVLVWRFAG